MILKKVIKNFIVAFIFTVFISLLFLIMDVLKKNTDIYKNEFKIVVFLKKDEKMKDVIYEKIKNISGIKDIKIFSKEDVKNLMQEYENEIKIIDNTNPFPDTFILNTVEYRINELKKIKNRLYEIEGIDEVSYDEDIPEIITKHKSYFNIIQSCIILVIFSISVFFIVILSLNFKNINFELLKNMDFYRFILTGQAGLISGVISLKIIIMRLIDLTVKYSVCIELQNVFVVSILILFLSLIEFFEVQER